MDLISEQGATAPGIGIGPIGGPAAEYCGEQFEQNGFIRVGQVGYDGVAVTSSRGQVARERLFGRIGDTRRLSVLRDGRKKTVTLLLAQKARS